MTLNFVPRGDYEGTIGRAGRSWLTGYFYSLYVQYLFDDTNYVYISDLALLIETFTALEALEGLLYCDGEGVFSVPESIAVNEEQKRVSIGKVDPQYTLDVSGNEAHPLAVLRQLNALGRGLRIIPGADALEALEVYNAAASVLRHAFLGSGDVHLALGAGKVGIGTNTPKSALDVKGLPEYHSNAAAIAGGLAAGSFYRNGADPDLVCVVH